MKPEFPDPERELPGAPLMKPPAQNEDCCTALVKRIVSNLEQLLGSSQIASRRLAEWRDTYTPSELVRCESTNTLEDELESLVSKRYPGENNQWVYQHRLRSLRQQAARRRLDRLPGT